MGRRTFDDAVSDVVGTVMILGITVTVFGGLSVAVLSYLDHQPEAPHADVEALQQGSSYLLTNKGGDPLPLSTRISYNNGGTTYQKTLAELGFTTPWSPGQTVCISGPDASCIYNQTSSTPYYSTSILGSMVLTQNSVIASDGDVTAVTSTTSSPGQPDLVITAITLNQATPAVNQSLVFTASLKNQGSANATGDLSVQFRLDGVSIGFATVAGPLASGATADLVSATWTATLGGHSVSATADPNGTVAEANEANNLTTQAFTVVAGLADPGLPFEDLNGDGLFTNGTDTALAATDVQDGSHDAGSHGLVIPASVGPIVASSIGFDAGGPVVIAVNLTATTNNLLVSSDANITVSGVLRALSDGKKIDLAADGFLNLAGATLQAVGDVDLDAGTSATLTSATVTLTKDGALFSLDAVSISAANLVATAVGELSIEADTALDLAGASLTSTKDGSQIDLDGATSIGLVGATLQAVGPINVGRTADATAIDLSGARLTSTKDGADIKVYTAAALTANATTNLTAVAPIGLQAGSMSVPGLRATSTKDGSQIKLEATAGTLTASNATLSGVGDITLLSTTGTTARDVQLTTTKSSATILLKSTTSGSAVDLQQTIGTTLIRSANKITVWAKDADIHVEGAELRAQANRDILLDTDDVSKTIYLDQARFALYGAPTTGLQANKDPNGVATNGTLALGTVAN